MHQVPVYTVPWFPAEEGRPVEQWPSVRLARARALGLLPCPHVRTLNLEHRLHAETLAAMAEVLRREPEDT